MIKQTSLGGPFIMARQKKPVHRVEMAECKRSIIHQLLKKYRRRYPECSKRPFRRRHY